MMRRSGAKLKGDIEGIDQAPHARHAMRRDRKPVESRALSSLAEFDGLFRLLVKLRPRGRVELNRGDINSRPFQIGEDLDLIVQTGDSSSRLQERRTAFDFRSPEKPVQVSPGRRGLSVQRDLAPSSPFLKYDLAFRCEPLCAPLLVRDVLQFALAFVEGTV